MKKYLFLLAIPFLFVMCKPTSNTSSSNLGSNSDISFDEAPPGTLYWIANAGWEAKGTFDKWKIVNFDVADNDYTQIKTEIAVEINSVNHDDKGLENHLRKDDYLAAKEYPVAKINIDGATYDKASDMYNCDAVVSLKGATHNVPLSFTVSNDSPAKIKGSGTLFRKNYNVGDDAGVNNEVGINFEFEVRN